MSKKEKVAIERKYALTLEEASAYFNIGRERLKALAINNNLLIMVGSKQLIRREKMEKLLDGISDI